MLSKESAITIPVVAACLELCWRDGKPRIGSLIRSSIGPASIRLGGFVLVAAGYVAWRMVVLHVSLGSYDGYHLASAPAHLGAFLYCAIFPIDPLRRFGFAIHHVHYGLYAAAVGVSLTVAWRNRSVTPLFPIVALLATLAPVLPLALGLEDAQGERFIYLPSAFAAMSTMMTVNSELWGHGRLVALGLSISLCGLNLLALASANQRFVEAGQLSAGIVSSFGPNVAAPPGGQSKIFVLNLPDTYRGVYVFRNGFLDALRMFQPVAAASRFILPIAGHSVSWREQDFSVRRTSSGSFHVDLGAETFPNPPLLPGTGYTVTAQGPHDFEITFTDDVDQALILYTTHGELKTAGFVEGRGPR